MGFVCFLHNAATLTERIQKEITGCLHSSRQHVIIATKQLLYREILLSGYLAAAVLFLENCVKKA